MQAGGEFQRDARVAARMDGEGNLFDRGERRCFQAAAAEFEAGQGSRISTFSLYPEPMSGCR